MQKYPPKLEYMLTQYEKQLVAAFDHGAAVKRKDGFISENPHKWGSDTWEAWREGFRST